MSKKSGKRTRPRPPAASNAGSSARAPASATAPAVYRSRTADQLFAEMPEPPPIAAEYSPVADESAPQGRGFTPANVTLLLECQAGFARGLAMMGHAMLGLTQESMQDAAQAGLALIDSRSFPSAWGLGMQLARDHVERVFRGSAALTEIGWQTATAACGPLFSLARTGFDQAREFTEVA